MVTYETERKRYFELKKSSSLASNLFYQKMQEQEKQYQATDDPVGGEATEPLGQLV